MTEDELLASYTWPDRHQPHVRANMVMSLDGSQALGGSSAGLSNDLDFRLLHHLRAHADVVVVGSTTAVHEKYTGIFVDDETVAARTAAGKAPYPTLAVLSRKGDVPLDSPCFQRTPVPTLILVTDASDDDLGDAERGAETIGAERCRVVDARGARGGLGSAIQRLQEMGFMHALSEGGPTIINRLVNENSLDELCLTISPRFAGGDSHRGALGDVDGYRGTFAASVGGLTFTRWSRVPGHGDEPPPEFRTFASLSGSTDD